MQPECWICRSTHLMDAAGRRVHGRDAEGRPLTCDEEYWTEAQASLHRSAEARWRQRFADASMTPQQDLAAEYADLRAELHHLRGLLTEASYLGDLAQKLGVIRDAVQELLYPFDAVERLVDRLAIAVGLGYERTTPSPSPRVDGAPATAGAPHIFPERAQIPQTSCQENRSGLTIPVPGTNGRGCERRSP